MEKALAVQAKGEDYWHASKIFNDGYWRKDFNI